MDNSAGTSAYQRGGFRQPGSGALGRYWDMADQEFQHFAAKVYLRAFIDPALKAKSKHQAWTYSPGVEPVATGVRDVAAEYGYYEVDVPGTEGFAEKEFGKVETAGSPILKKLREGEIDLTAKEKNTFALFVAMSMARVPVSRELIDVVRAETSRKAVELIARATTSTRDRRPGCGSPIR